MGPLIYFWFMKRFVRKKKMIHECDGRKNLWDIHTSGLEMKAWALVRFDLKFSSPDSFEILSIISSDLQNSGYFMKTWHETIPYVSIRYKKTPQKNRISPTKQARRQKTNKRTKNNNKKTNNKTSRKNIFKRNGEFGKKNHLIEFL